MEILDLPEHVIVIIFSYLNFRDFFRVARVCREWSRLARDHSLWRTVDIRSHNNSIGKMTTSQVKSVIRNYMSIQTTDLILESTVSSELLEMLTICCPNLRQLALYACHLEGTSPYVGQLHFPQLKTLDWRMTHGFLTELSHLSVECENIENLGLGQQLSGVSGDQLFIHQHHLKILDCHGCYFITDRSLEVLAANCPHLISVSFINCPNLEGNTLPSLVARCRQLKTLRMRGQKLRGSALEEVDWRRTSVIEVDLRNIDRVMDSSLVLMLGSLQQLRYLRCPVTNYILTQLRPGFPCLQVLKLSSNFPISRDNLTTFLCACPNLTVLDISTEPVDASQFATFLPCLPNLKYLSIAGEQDTPITVELLELFCPILQALSVQFYRVNNNLNLSTALTTLILANKNMRTVSVSGINIEAIIDETRSGIHGRLGTRQVKVSADTFFEGIEVVPPLYSLDSLLKTTFRDYQVISEKRLPSSRILSVRRFLSDRHQ